MSFGNSRLRSTKSGLPHLLSRDAYTRLASAGDLREYFRRVAARIALGAYPDPTTTQQYEQEWGRPQSLDHEIKEVERLIQDWRRRGGDISLLTPVLGALRQELAMSHDKVAEVQESDEEMVRVASFNDMPEGFSAVGGGFYRSGHSIWELRGAEDEEGGYLLARKREERAVDMRPQASAQATSETKKASSMRCASCLPRGTSALFIKQGQVLPIIVIEVHDDHADVEDEAGQQMQAPLDMIVTDMTVKAPPGAQLPQQTPPAPQVAPMQVMPAPMPALMPGTSSMSVPSAMPAPSPVGETMEPGTGCDCDRGCSCPCHNGKSVKKAPVQGMEPKVEPSSKDPDAAGESSEPDQSNESSESSEPAQAPEPDQDDGPPSNEEMDGAIKNAFYMRAFGPEEAWGKLVRPTKSFAPQYMGGRFTFDPEQRDVYEVEGTSRADPQRDRMYGIPNPILPYPNAKGGEWTLNDRVRLIPHGGGEPIFVSPLELERNFDMAEGAASTSPRGRGDEGRPGREHRVQDDPNQTPAWDDYRVNPEMPGEPVTQADPSQLPTGVGRAPGTERTQVTRQQMPVQPNPARTQVTRPPSPARKPLPR